MNWDRLSAKDLLVLFNSFKPPTAIIHRVAIYPSEFGKTRMAEEALKGPAELVQETLPETPRHDQDEEEEDETEKERMERRQREKVRAYQIQRLRYYYAVVQCDSAETAEALYTACNGVEYESSAEKLDLRFIPDDTDFDDSEIKDQAADLGDLSKYEPAQYADSALQQIAVQLTWDESDPTRAKRLRRAFEDAADDSTLDAVRQYVASGSSSEDEDAGGIHAYRDILHTAASSKPEFGKGKELMKEEEGLEMKWDADDKDPAENDKKGR